MKTDSRLLKKELFVGDTREEAEAWEGYRPMMHEILQDPVTELFQVFKRSRSKAVKPVTHPIKRQSAKNYKHYRHPIILTVLPDDLIQMHLKGTIKSKHVETWESVFEWMGRRAAEREATKKLTEKDKKNGHRPRKRLVKRGVLA